MLQTMHFIQGKTLLKLTSAKPASSDLCYLHFYFYFSGGSIKQFHSQTEFVLDAKCILLLYQILIYKVNKQPGIYGCMPYDMGSITSKLKSSVTSKFQL